MINSKFYHVAKGVCMGLLAITSLSSFAIENGQHDYMHHNVGALGFDLDGPDNPIPPLAFCSGFVISDRAFVTAAHCIDLVDGFSPSYVVTLEPGQWAGPIESGYGLHLMKVLQRDDATIPDWTDVRSKLITDMQFEASKAAKDQLYAEIAPRYQILYDDVVASVLEGAAQ